MLKGHFLLISSRNESVSNLWHVGFARTVWDDGLALGVMLLLRVEECTVSAGKIQNMETEMFIATRL